MKSRCLSLTVAIAAITLGITALSNAKEIRLRNETIQPDQALKRGLQGQAQGERIKSSLFLVQFTNAPAPEFRAGLKKAGLDLLHPVPFDAFVVRFKPGSKSLKDPEAAAEWLRSMPEVLWVGAYRPEHKVRQDLQFAAAQPSTEAEVAVLLVPDADATELSAARRNFSRIESESTIAPGTVLKGKLSTGQVSTLANSDAVLWIEPRRSMRLFDEPASKLVAGDGGKNLLFTQSLGYDGSGVKVAVADSGLNNGDAETMHPDLLGRTPTFFYYGLDGQLEDASDEHSHGTHVAGIIAGNGATSEVDENGLLYGLGVAPGASIIAQRIFDGVGNYAAPPSFERLTRDAKRAGADIGSNSWGDDTQGAYDISAMEFDALVRDADALTPGDQEYILEFSAGNAGPVEGSIGSPAVAKNVIATGASQSDRTEFLIYGDGIETMADFSSRGPCKDGRIKPDVVAPGTYIASLQSQSATDTYAWAPISPNYQYQGGTSQAGPHASGAAAVFVQYYRETHGATPSPALVKAALINSAVDLDDTFGTAPVPNMDEGWGRIYLPSLLDGEVDVEYVDQTFSLTNSQVFEKRVIVDSDVLPLKVTLTYTDYPGLPSAAAALVNDLDLEVVAPDGTLFRGNQFLNGESVPGAQHPDNINNVEGVLVGTTMRGEYIIRIRAQRILSDARRDTNPADQDFALVVSAGIASPGHAQLMFDRDAYRAPGTIGIFLADSDLAGASTASVRVSSATEPAGELITLLPNGAGGAFTGVVVTATGPAQTDGKLQIANGNTITGTYNDLVPGTTRTCTAVADLLGPIITSVSTKMEFGSPEITWTSSEPADSAVFFRSQTGSYEVAFDSELLVSHAINLGNVQRDVAYFYYVVSSDAAGNTTTNNNSGALYTFIIPSSSSILLVDGWPNDPMLLGAPSLDGYTSALNQLGVQYEVWDASLMGSPSNVLANFSAVIWRLPELWNGWTSGERAAVSNYLHTGGAMLIASMEVMSRVEETGDTSFLGNVLQVSSYVTDSGVGQVSGEATDPLVSGFDSILDYQVYEDLWGGLIPADISDTFSPGPNASVLLRDEFGDAVGSRWPGLGKDAPGRLVLLSFPLDAITFADRCTLLSRIMAFLVPGSTREAVLTLNSSAFAVSGTAKITLGDSDLSGTTSVTVSASTGTQPTPVGVTLAKSGNSAEFSGRIQIVGGTAGPGQISATNGDTLVIEYNDASSGSIVTATASVDSTQPVISSVTADPDYLDAVIYWDTDEPSDSLVLFGESALLGRNAYSSALDTAHAIGLSGLTPNRTYYYKVLSRDPAGNLVEANNGGELYSFKTLLPLLAPWADNMDGTSTEWTSYSDSEVGGGAAGLPDWTRGIPDNGVETAAHTPPYCWGSNLKGGSMDSAEMFLLSPAIYLPAGSSATLRFWHSYEFNDYSGFDLEFGALQISVNNGALQDLTSYFDSSSEWEEEVVDLTPYAGKMIYLTWHYMLLGFEGGPRPGWLVDDVAITTSSFSAGMVQVTNNLWQAAYVLSGPVFREGKGDLVVSNAPPGQYFLEFAPVPYYITPPSQTNTLQSGGTLLFNGNYGFADANNNGISDEWELDYFGSVDPARTKSTNSDADGMSDYAEFVVGTDPTSATGNMTIPGELRLQLEQIEGGQTRLTWLSPNACGYLVQQSSNLKDWTPASPWIRATARTTTYTLPSPGNSPVFYRLRAAP